MNIMPYRDEKDKRQAFIYGSAIGGLVGFGIASFLLAAGGVFLYPKFAAQAKNVPEAATAPYDVAGSPVFWKENFLPKPTLAAQTQPAAPQGGVVQAWQISGQSAGIGGPVAPASIPLPAVPVAPSFPSVQTTPAVAAPVQPVVQATTSATEETAHPKSTETVVAQGANYQDGRIAFIGGTDVPIQSNENGTR